jgi:hypothetical protein
MCAGRSTTFNPVIRRYAECSTIIRVIGLAVFLIDQDQGRDVPVVGQSHSQESHSGGTPMIRSLELVCLLVALISFAATTSGEAKVLRSKGDAPAVLIFRDADALRKFGRLTDIAVHDDNIVTPLLACKALQGSKIKVLGSGYRTAFVRVAEGSANGCEGTVPKANVKDQ